TRTDPEEEEPAAMNDTVIAPHDVLHIKKRRRLNHAFEKDAEGREGLFIYYGQNEICFDDPELIPFGKGLLERARFVASDARAWGGGDRRSTWDRVLPLLSALLEEEILSRDAAPEAAGAAAAGPRPDVDPPPPVTAADHPTWSQADDRCRALTERLFG